jgi:hypothetical protein
LNELRLLMQRAEAGEIVEDDEWPTGYRVTDPL